VKKGKKKKLIFFSIVMYVYALRRWLKTQICKLTAVGLTLDILR